MVFHTDLGVLEAVTTAVRDVTTAFMCKGEVIKEPTTSLKDCKKDIMFEPRYAKMSLMQ
ncbi:hypothetical protein DPMN_170734 [Dreissena polymorpha]|uniref:Uncharacterized protein n=1 Tax=Dreissena polymorpha TaxID=45954 RepID=A0A9D4DZ52_DREPO|nr:hypothetical protein DPMN_170734 [Dreissena polymorpha]